MSWAADHGGGRLRLWNRHRNLHWNLHFHVCLLSSSLLERRRCRCVRSRGWAVVHSAGTVCVPWIGFHVLRRTTRSVCATGV